VNSPKVFVRQAHPEEARLVAEVLTAAATHLAARGHALWDLPEVSEEAIAPHVRAGLYFIADDEEGPVGVFRFQLEDRYFWPEITDNASAFIHKLAVHPRVQGRDIAQLLLAQACEIARQHGRRYLRLDCMHGRPKLSSVYQRFGFRLHSQVRLGSELFERYEIEVAGTP
jgi:GNAT superfamily N-acetyltransferase